MSKTKHKPQIVPSQIGISSILKTYWLRVPPLQREYRWKAKHVEQLFEDLNQAIELDRPQYFLGTIVTIPEESSGVLEIVDGQQRLATITILISCIRRYLESIEPKLAASLEQYLCEYDRGQKVDIPKLKLNLLDNAFFANMLAAKPPYPELLETDPLSHRRIRNAFACADEYMKKIVAAANVKDHGQKLNRWLDFIESDAEVILFRVPTGANAYKMFETLNDRGLRTTQADLVKTFLFGQADDRWAEAQTSWSGMLSTLSSLQGDDDDETDDEKVDLTVIFLRAALMCKQGFLTSGDVYEAIQTIVRGPTTAVTLMKDFERLARVYEATFYQDHEKWKPYPDAMRCAIQTVNDFNIKPLRPALLAIAAEFQAEEASKSFVWFASIGVRLLITIGTRTGSVEQTFAALAHKVCLGELKSAAEVKTFLADLIPTNAQFKQAFLTATVTSGPHARYYLRALENVARKGQQPWWVPNQDKEAMTLEHVLPLRPGDNWPQFTEDEVKAFAKRIGNLCLLPKTVNADLKNANQETKFAIYKETPYALTSQIAEAEIWNVDAICKRQVGLADLALKAWPL